MKVHYSSKSSDWETPAAFFHQLNRVHKFDLDVCASEKNAKCYNYINEEMDSLSQPWHLMSRVAWMNPPYGREIGKWMKKAYEESLKGVKVVCLVPARTDTKWWHDYAMKGDIEFIKGRLKFNDCENSAPFPNAIVVFNKKEKEKWYKLKFNTIKHLTK